MSDPATHAVFLSYAREDAEIARRIADGLRAFGVEVWFDMNELRGGDAWDAKLRTQIRTCTLFLPVISATTQARTEGYFRREWKLAVERTHDMAGGVAFIVPVVVDETAESAAVVPDEFMKVQWTRLAHGMPTPAFVEQVKRLLEHRSAEPARSHPAASTAASMIPASKKRLPLVMVGVAVLLVGGIAATVYLGRRPAEPAPATPSAIPAAPAPRIADKSIAVIPFTNMSDEKDSAFFTDGIHEDILTNLALIRELRVVSRTSVLKYRGTQKSMKEIAQELGVTYILEGSVRRVGNKVRVTGQLIHAATDEHVWAQAFDRDITDIFAIQTELSQQIAGALRAALSPEEKALIARKPTENPAAYDLFLRARDVVNREGNTVAARTRQIALLQGAVDLDPTFAQAWGELAASCAYWYFLSMPDMDAYLARAKTAIDRAVQLAPEDPEIYGSLGTYYYYGFRDYARAAEQYEKRAKLQPNSAVVFNSLALIQRRQGQWARSLANSRRACELDPANIAYLRNLLATQRAGRRWGEALETKRRIVTLLPGDLKEAYELAWGHFLASGSTREVEAFFAGLTPAQRDSQLGVELRKTWAGVVGDFREVIRLDRLQPYYDEEGAAHHEQAFSAALAYYSVGDREGARARLGNFPAELRARLEREPGSVRLWSFLAGMEILCGRPEEALRCAAKTMELLPESRDALDGVTYAAFRAQVYDLSGEKEKALAEYTRLFRQPATVFMNVHEFRRAYSNLKDDPRYQALLDDPANNAPLF